MVWVPLAQAARRHLYPAVGNALSELTEPTDPPSDVLLPPITDQTYTWR
ncbi:hypothetical protein ABZ938_24090 [Streptomyces sp. NPDC046409]